MIGTSTSTKVKISNILDSQILDFIHEESPDFKDFLNQYYVSEEREFGSTYISDNLTSLKNISDTSNNILNVSVPNILAADPSRSYDSSINAFNDEIPVTTTAGYPDQYGLFKIDNEIITYTGKTPTSFIGCVRGLSAISSIEKSEYLTFSETDSDEHFTNLQINVDNDGNRIIEEYKVTVESKDETHPYWQSEYTAGVSPNGYLLDGNQAPPLTLLPGHTYRFDQSDISNNAHPIRFYLEANKTTSYGSEIIGGEEKPANEVIYYADGIKDKVDEYYSSFGTASVRYIQITVDYGTPTVLYYMCTNHGYMGNAAQINQNGGRPVLNLSSIFVNEFYRKHKSQFLPGFEGRNFVNQVNIENVLTRAKDFYRSKGTDTSLEILFKVLFGKNVVIEKPFENTIGSSDSEWVVTDNMIVDVIEGDPFKLISTKIFQGTFDNPTADGTISNIQEVFLGSKKYYKLSFDKSAHFGSFKIGAKTKVTERLPGPVVGLSSVTINVDSTIGFSGSNTSGGSFIYPNNVGGNIEFLVAEYGSKSENQFFECTGIVDNGLNENSDIFDDTLIFGYEDSDPEKVCTMRITGTLSKPSENVSNSKYASVGEKIRVNYLGEKISGPKFDTWLYNHTSTFDIEGVEFQTIKDPNNEDIELGEKTDNFITKNPNNFLYKGCKVDIIRYDWVGVGRTTAETGIYGRVNTGDPGLGAFSVIKRDVEITDINPVNGYITLKNGAEFPSEFYGGLIDKTKVHKIKKKLSYVDSNLTKSGSAEGELPDNLLTNIQNSYVDDIGNTYVSFTGFPSYELNTTNRSAKSEFFGNTGLNNFGEIIDVPLNDTFTTDEIHSFITGEQVFFNQNSVTYNIVTKDIKTTVSTGSTESGEFVPFNSTLDQITEENDLDHSTYVTSGIGLTDNQGNEILQRRYFVSKQADNELKLAFTLDAVNNNDFITFYEPQRSDGISTVSTSSTISTIRQNLILQANESDNFYSTTGVSIVESGSGQGSNGGFVINNSSGIATSYLSFAQSDGSRTLILKKIDSTPYSGIRVYAKVGNDENGGEEPDPDSNEELYLEYYNLSVGINTNSPNSALFSDIDIIIPALNNNVESTLYNDGSLKTFYLDLPSEARAENTYFKLVQFSNSGPGFDHYGIQKIEFLLDGGEIGITTTTTIETTFKTESIGIVTCTITPFELYQNTLKNQNSFKRILKTPEVRESEKIINGAVGVQLNGVELHSPVLKEYICYGQIDNVVVTNSGKNYDVVNPPNVLVTDANGSGATLHGHFSGDISEIIVTNPGFDYADTPQISVTGGNIEKSSTPVIGKAHMRGFTYSFSFNDQNGLNNYRVIKEDNTIVHLDRPHKFTNGEEVVYTTTGRPIGIGSTQVGFTTTMLTSGATYFIRKNNDFSFSLTVRKSDAIAGINTIDLVPQSTEEFTYDYGTGTHTLASRKIRKIIDRITISDKGGKYQNRKVLVDSTYKVKEQGAGEVEMTTTIVENIYPPLDPKNNLTRFTGINIYDNYIFAKNHGFSEGDIIEYACSSFENRIVGLNTITQYRINKVSNDKFKLSDKGPNEDANYAVGSTFHHTLRLISHTYVSGATSWQQVDDHSSNAGFIRIKLNNLRIGEKYRISLNTDFQINFDNSARHSRITHADGSQTKFSDWDGKIGVLTGEFTAVSENDDKFLFYVNAVSSSEATANISNFKVELIENKIKDYERKIYADLHSVGVGTHTFKYQDIAVNIKGNPNTAGLITSTSPSFTTPSHYNATAYPVISGSLDNVFVQNGGEGFGTNDIFNYNVSPVVQLDSGKGAELSAQISQGRILNVSIGFSGTGYTSPPTLNVVGVGTTSGKYAKLRANVLNGNITSVTIIDSGKDYISGETVINVVPTGVDCRLKANVHKWNLNALKRYKNVLGDSSFKETTQVSSRVKLQNKIVSFYAGSDYRKTLNDNVQSNNSEEVAESLVHSPIIGWSYDGNPIYGPYGYINPISGANQVSKIKSGYRLNVITNSLLRPQSSEIEDGYFTEDYQYQPEDNSHLDRFNGRFGVTPDFPNGTYAYFITKVADNSDYQFPYTTFIHRNKTDMINYNIDFQQSDKHIDSGVYKRNVLPLGLNEKNREYLPLSEPLTTNHQFKVNACLPGKIDEITTFESGINYKVGDTINLNDTFVDAFVEEISGKEIKKVESVELTVNNLNFSSKDNIITASSDTLHSFFNNDFVQISGITSSSYFGIQGIQQIGVTTATSFVSVAIGNTSDTGITTSINLDTPVNSNTFEINDIIQVDNEKLLIIGLDRVNNKYVVSRMHDNSTGGAHSVDSAVTRLERSFTFKVSGKKIKDTNVNKEKIAYIDVTNSIGIGSSYTSVIVGSAGSSNIVKSIPPRAIYIPDHNFKNGDKVSLVSIGGTIFGSPNSSLNPELNLSTFNPLYCVKINNNYIGLSTQKVGFLTSYVYYKRVESDNDLFGKGIQIKTNNNAVTGSASRVNGLITLGTSHNILTGDTIRLNISPNRTKQIKFDFNKHFRVLTIGAGTTTDVGINSTLSTIKINNHGLETGDGVIYDVGIGLTPAGGLNINKIYYAIKITNDTIKLAETYKRATKARFASIGITTSGIDTINHTLSKINPKIQITRGNNLEIDVSDFTIDNTEQNLDINFYNSVDFKNKIGSNFIEKTGEVGATNSKINIKTGNTSLEKIYYKVESNLLLDNFTNSDIKDHSLIDIVETKFNNLHTVSGIGNTTIIFNSKVGSAETTFYTSYESSGSPDFISYSNSGFSTATYSTNSRNEEGSISKINIINFGKNTNIIPSVTSIGTTTGINAVISILSDNIAKVEDTEVISQGWEFPKNKSLKPKADTYAILDLKNTLTLKSIGIDTGGKSYTTSPKVIGVGNDNIITKSFIDGNSVSLVDIVANDSGLEETLRIVPTFNSNGVSVINATSSNKNLTLSLRAPLGGFTYGGNPFSVGDEIFVENVQIKLIPEGFTGAGTTTLASYNSSAYDYSFFKVIAVSDGSASADPTVTYSISGLTTATEAGNFDGEYIFGRVIKAGDLAAFKPKFENVEYVDGEVIDIGNDTTAVVSENGWNPKSKTLKVTNINGKINKGDNIIGSVNSQKAVISDFNVYEFDLDVDVFAESLGFWKSDKNKPNFSYERLHDNDYYQKFSYALRSQVDLDTWREPVNSLGHVAGYKNFSDYEIINNKFAGIVGVSSSVEFKVEIESSASVHEQFDYDFVSEKETLGTEIAREVNFANKKLTDYIEARTNKVLLIDDISNQFTGLSTVTGQLVGLTTFAIKSGGENILHQVFNPANLTVGESNINITEHGFLDGEELEYAPNTGGSSIGIVTTTAPGVSETSILPSKVFADVKDSNNFSLVIKSSETAVGSAVTFYSIAGIGNTHTLSVNSREASIRSLITIDNIIQSPLGKKLTVLGLSTSVGIGSTQIFLNDISKLSGNSLLEINDEIMLTSLVGVGFTNSVNVVRGYMGTVAAAHTVGAGVSELYGNYRISKGNIYFSDAPYGSVGIGTISGSKLDGNTVIPIPNAMTTRSTFSGRVFFRLNDSALPTPRSNMYSIIDDISDSFDGTTKLFDMKENGEILPVGINTYGGAILVNNIFQKPFLGDVGSIRESDYRLQAPVGGGTTIQFLANPDIPSDTTDIPRGGRINEFLVGVGSGYQVPTRALAYANIGAGGTIASVSISTHGQGYISSPRVSIGVSYANYVHKFIKSLPNSINPNSGSDKTPTFAEYDSFTGDLLLVIPNHGLTTSNTIQIVDNSLFFTCSRDGYKKQKSYPRTTDPVSGIQTSIISATTNTIIVNVGAGAGVGAAFTSVVSAAGTITAINVVNPGTGYTATKDNPFIIIDEPTPYKNIPLIGGNGSGAKMDVVVGTGGSIINFSIADRGIGYEIGDNLSLHGLPVQVGIGTSAFNITVRTRYQDKFSGYTFGELIELDDFSRFFNGFKRAFFLTRTKEEKEYFSIIAKEGSGIILENNLLVFVNDILQKPGIDYKFEGGTRFKFTEAPKAGSRFKLYFYKGSEDDVEVIEVDETIKPGDILTLDKFVENKGEIKNPELGPFSFKHPVQDPRVVYEITAADVVDTQTYTGPGISDNEDYERPVRWKKQTADRVIDGERIPKDRNLNTGQLYPATNIIAPVGVNDTSFSVQDIISFGGIDDLPGTNSSVKIISQNESKVAEATSTINTSTKEVTQITVGNAGFGYATAPKVSIQPPTELFTYQVSEGTDGKKYFLKTSNTATATATINSEGTVTGITVTNPGVGYTFTPLVSIELPKLIEESFSNIGYNGDRGTIIGINSSSNGSNSGVSTDSPALIFDLYTTQQLPGAASTKSGIVTGQYIVIKGTSFGDGIVSIGTHTSKVVSVGNSFADNVYQVGHYVDVGAGSTIRRITCNILSGINTNTGIGTTLGIMGDYSWGTITLPGIRNGNEFAFYNQNGVLGIKTSAHIRRTLQLKSIY